MGEAKDDALGHVDLGIIQILMRCHIALTAACGTKCVWFSAWTPGNELQAMDGSFLPQDLWFGKVPTQMLLQGIATIFAELGQSRYNVTMVNTNLPTIFTILENQSYD